MCVLCVYVCIYIHIYVYVCTYIYMCVCVCMYMCICICMYVCVYIYIYTYLSLNPAIEIFAASNHLLNATEWINRFRRKYLFHIVVKSLNRILYRSMPSGDILQQWEMTSNDFRWHPPVFVVCCLGSLSFDTYFNLRHLFFNVCYILWPELIVWPKCLSV